MDTPSKPFGIVLLAASMTRDERSAVSTSFRIIGVISRIRRSASVVSILGITAREHRDKGDLGRRYWRK